MQKREFLHTATLGACAFAFGGRLLRRGDESPATESPKTPPDKYTREALFYEKTDAGIRCHKCPHECALQEGETGICRSRMVINAKLCTTAYGNPCAVHIDPVEKKPFYHFLPSTRAFSIAVAGCNLRCLNCQNWQISQVRPDETHTVDLMPDRVVEECIAGKCGSIAYTYSEPTTFYEYAFDTATAARKKGIRNLLKSNGYILEKPLRKLCSVLDAANIDLKGFDAEVYKTLNSATLEPVLRTLKVLKEENVWLEITNLVIPSWTDKLDVIAKMCDWLVANGLADCPLHFSRFTPLYKLNHLPPTPVSILDRAKDIARAAGMQYVYVGNVPGHPAESTFCHKCGSTVIERKGFVILRNSLKANACPKCGTPIPGVWK